MYGTTNIRNYKKHIEQEISRFKKGCIIPKYFKFVMVGGCKFCIQSMQRLSGPMLDLSMVDAICHYDGYVLWICELSKNNFLL
jgi:hypothetical protein